MQIKQGKSQKIAASENLKSNLNFRYEKFSRILKYSDTRWAAMNIVKIWVCSTPAKWLWPSSCRSRLTRVIAGVQSGRSLPLGMEDPTPSISSTRPFFPRARRHSTLARLPTRAAVVRLRCGRFCESCEEAGLWASLISTRCLPRRSSAPHSLSDSSSLLAMTGGNRRSNRSLWTKEGWNWIIKYWLKKNISWFHHSIDNG